MASPRFAVFVLLAGVSWADPVQPLGSALNPAYSAKQIFMNGASTGNGLYWIDPDGPGGIAPYQIYADMTTAGGGWTLGLNSLAASRAATTDMVSNTGTPGLALGNTANVQHLAIDQNAQIRHRIMGANNSVLLDAYYTGNYHGVLPAAGSWTVIAGNASLLTTGPYGLYYHLGRSWSTASNDVDGWPSGNCAAYYGTPWYYNSCFTAHPTYGADPNSLHFYSNAGFLTVPQWSIYVREVNTPPYVPPTTVPEPMSYDLILGAALGAAVWVKRARE